MLFFKHAFLLPLNANPLRRANLSCKEPHFLETAPFKSSQYSRFQDLKKGEVRAECAGFVRAVQSMKPRKITPAHGSSSSPPLLFVKKKSTKMEHKIDLGSSTFHE